MSGKFGGGGTKCKICDKTAYPAETISFEKIPYHVDCFRCIDCNQKMAGPSKAALYDEKLYCQSCFKKNGFAQKQKNVSWTKSESGSSGTSKFGGGGISCVVCSKTVYAAELVSFEKKPYHGACMNCSHCGKKALAPSDATVFTGDDDVELMFCKKCFVSEGYNRKQSKTTHKKTTGGAASSRFGGGGVKCYVCNKTVYAAETIQYEKKPFHEECFKCKHCSKKLTPSGAEGKKLDDGGLDVYCKKCWGEQGLNRAKVVQKTDDAAEEPAAEEAAAEEPAAEEPAAEEPEAE